MTAPTMEQMLDELKRETVRICSRLMHACYDRHGALMPDAYPIESRPHVGEMRHTVTHIRALTARFAELERERDAYRALAGQAETALRNCGCDMNADLIRRAIAQRAGETG